MSDSLVCRSNGLLCALPLAFVDETMRPLPVARLSGAPRFVLGAALIRGRSSSVFDLGVLLGGDVSSARRFVSLRCSDQGLALAVDEVVGVRRRDQLPGHSSSSVLQGSAWVETLRAIQPELLRLLGDTLLFSDECFA